MPVLEKMPCTTRKRSLIAVFLVSLTIIPFFLFFARTNRASASPADGFAWPVAGKIIRGFEKPNGLYGEGGHQGVDIAARRNSTVRASGDGTVAWVGELPRGRFVSIDHAGGVRTTYLDLETIEVSAGQSVRLGQRIGTVHGLRDDSSAESHLHFSAYVHGTPVDPRLLTGGMEADSYIRLCPVERAGGSRSPPGEESGSEPGFLSVVIEGLSEGGSLLGDLFGTVVDGASVTARAVFGGISSLFEWAGCSLSNLWSRYLYPALSRAAESVWGALEWVWSNRYVQAVAAGLLAAVVVVGLVIVAVLAIGVSAAVAVVAAVAGALACLVMAIYYTATGPEFSFLGCFLSSLTGGMTVAGLVISAGSMSGLFAAGWAKVGLLGTLKASAWGGLFSALFEVATGLLFNGAVNWKQVLVSFGLGAVAAGLGRLLKAGLQAKSIAAAAFFSATRASGIVAAGHSVSIWVRRFAYRGVVVVFKKVALSAGTRVAYMAFMGCLGSALNTLACTFSGRPITFSSTFSSFLTGVVVAGIALSFGGEGIKGLLSRFRVFQEGLGRSLKGVAARLINKGMSKGLKRGLREGFEEILGEEEAGQ
jgi:hypothetical protein